MAASVQMHRVAPKANSTKISLRLSGNRYGVADTIPETRKVLHRITEMFNCPRERPALLVVLI